MSKESMPAAEAELDTNVYELAFHVLPTVAEGEVTTVVDTIKAHITAHDGTITNEEAPARFELAYEIVKHLEGRNRKFTSAYFGWVRFTVAPDQVEAINAEVEAIKEVLRSMTIKLTKIEEENPFFFHEAMATPKEETIEVPAEEVTETTEATEDKASADDNASGNEASETETEAEETVDGEKTE
jgi:ribosomal protein S6